ncbi:MAG TPA: hypothetical protein PKL31_17950 [Fulvivirga sp.]|nr:hypothetical protein [Fulvivirga sp.]
MKTGKTLVLLLGVATGAIVTAMTVGRTGKRARSLFAKKMSQVENAKGINQYDDSDINYV